MKKLSLILVLATLFCSITSCNFGKETFTVRWLNYDGTVLEVDNNVVKGTIPQYDGETPKKPHDENHSYSFLNWYTVPLAVDKDIDYIAQFRSVPMKGNDILDDIDPDQMAFDGAKYLIENYVPGGSVITTAIDWLFDTKQDDGPSLSDIKDGLDSLRDEVNTQFKEIENQISDLQKQQEALGIAIENQINSIGSKLESTIINQTSFSTKQATFESLLSSFQITDRQLKTLHSSTSMSEQSKAVQIAALIGRNSDWTTSGNMYNQYLNFLNIITGTSFGDLQGRDILQVIYDSYYSTDLMFTGEVMYRATMYTDRLAYLALEAFSVCYECLEAAKEVTSFTSQDIDKLDNDSKNLYTSGQVTSPYDIVVSEMEYLKNKVFKHGFEEVSFIDRMDAFYSKDRRTYIYKGEIKESLLNSNLYYFTQSDMGSTYSGDHEYEDSVDAYKTYNLKMYDLTQITKDQIGDDIGFMQYFHNYIQSNYKDMCVRDVLNMLDYDTSSFDSNAILVTSFDFVASTDIEGLWPTIYAIGMPLDNKGENTVRYKLCTTWGSYAYDSWSVATLKDKGDEFTTNGD